MVQGSFELVDQQFGVQDNAHTYTLSGSKLSLAMSSSKNDVSSTRPTSVKKDPRVSQQAEASSNQETTPDKVDDGRVESEAGSLAPAASAEASAGVLLWVAIPSSANVATRDTLLSSSC